MMNKTDTFDANIIASQTTLSMICVVCVILLTISVYANTALILIYYKHNHLRTSLNLIKVTLALVNLFGSIVEFPSVIFNTFMKRFMGGRILCTLFGFIMYFIGSLGIYLMIVISFERYWMLQNPKSLHFLSYNACVMAIFLSFVLSFIWAFLPIVGWSVYSLEGIGISCSVEWRRQSANVKSYNITIFLAVFIIPLIVLIVTNIKLVLILKKSRKNMMLKLRMQTVQLHRRYKKERHLTYITIALIVLFMTSWLPYGIVSLYTAFIDCDAIPPLIATIPSIFGKSALVWPSLWTIIINTDFRRHLIFWRKKEISAYSY